MAYAQITQYALMAEAYQYISHITVAAIKDVARIAVHRLWQQ